MNYKYSILMRSVLVLLLALACQVEQSQAGKGRPGGGGGGGKAVDVPIEVTFGYWEGARILNMGDPTYSNGQDGVLAIIDAAQGWVRLHTCNSANPKSPCLSTGRLQSYDYTVSAGGSSFINELHIAGGNLSVHPVDAAGVHLANGFRDLMNYPGETRVASMKVNYSVVYSDGSFINYTTRFAPGMYPDSNYVLVTFNGGTLDCSGPDGCASWTVEAFTGDLPPGDYPVSQIEDIAQLVDWKNSLDFGLYHMPFKLTVTVKAK